MALIELNVQPRQETGKNANRRTRASGRVPGIIYGAARASACIEVDATELHRALVAHGGGTAILSLGDPSGEGPIAILREIQRHPVSDEILHVDLFEIPRDRPVVVPVRVEVVGESPAMRRGDANLILNLDAVDVSCLPREMPDALTVDVSAMGVGDRVLVKDLRTPVGEIVEDPDVLVLSLKAPTLFVEEPAAEAEGEAAAEAEGGAEGEKAEKGDKAEKKDKKDKKED